MSLRTRLARLEKEARVGQPPCPADYVAAWNALQAGAAEVRVGEEVITRADWLAAVAEARRLVTEHRRQRTGSGDLPPAVEARFRRSEGTPRP